MNCFEETILEWKQKYLIFDFSYNLTIFLEFKYLQMHHIDLRY